MPTLVTHRWDDGVSHLETRMALLAGNWTIGATGAVGAKVGGIGMTLTRTAAGTYSVQLNDSHGNDADVPYILAAMPAVEEADTDPTDDTTAHWAKLLATSAGNGTITFQTTDEAGVVRDPAEGALIHLIVVAKLSSVTR